MTLLNLQQEDEQRVLLAALKRACERPINVSRVDQFGRLVTVDDEASLLATERLIRDIVRRIKQIRSTYPKSTSEPDALGLEPRRLMRDPTQGCGGGKIE